MIVNKLQLNEALGACGLHDEVSYSKLQHNVQLAKENPTILSFFTPIDVDAKIINNKENRNVIELDGSGDVSPLTLSSLSEQSSSSSSTRKKHRKSPKQACLERLALKQQKNEYDLRLKAAFKEATNLAADGDPQPVETMLVGINAKYNLDGKKKVPRSSVYRAVKNGVAGKSPPKRGPAPKVPLLLLKAVAAHVEVNLVKNGELRGKDIKRLIGASAKSTVWFSSVC